MIVLRRRYASHAEQMEAAQAAAACRPRVRRALTLRRVISTKQERPVLDCSVALRRLVDPRGRLTSAAVVLCRVRPQAPPFAALLTHGAANAARLDEPREELAA